ncbi:unnamed protein product [Clonostachys chloroleuca]|uniref:Uncharacterized protein n=1 Tax=Clonostachys chloroleuca TaxID=1926264 RepID=A0AA35Q3Z8_9HYPO|nr:unnamed protein product [Clonostachys chloroleuca]
MSGYGKEAGKSVAIEEYLIQKTATEIKPDTSRIDDDVVSRYVVSGLPVPHEVQALREVPSMSLTAMGGGHQLLRGYGVDRGINERKNRLGL